MTLQWLDGPNGRLAVRHRRGTGPALLFLPGYASAMMGSKAQALDVWAETQGHSMLRFDYSGTGESPGLFADGTLDRWLEDAEAVASLIDQPLILVGSSMGGWLVLHLAEQLGERVRALVGIAAAPDFTDWGYTPEDKQHLAAHGELRRSNPYGGEAELTTLAFWQSGERLQLLNRPIAFDGPVRLLHGDRDAEVPLDLAFRIKERLTSTDVQVTMVKGGTHRLSAPHELRLLCRTVADLVFSDAAAT